MIWSFVLAAVGIAGIYLAGKKSKWGWGLGLAANERLSQMNRDILRRKIEAGQEVTSDQLRLAKTTRHDLEMEIKLDKIREDPEKYFQEARKKAYDDIVREDREALLRPFRKVLDWMLRRR